MTTPAAEGGTTPAASSTTTAPAVAAQPAAVPQPGDENQPWFKERLARAEEQARTKALAELGITDPVKAKKLLDDAAKAEDEKKSQGEKLGETSKQLEAEKAERTRLAEVVKDHAARQITALTVEQQAAIRAIAPDADPAGQLRAIDALRPTWGSSAPAVAATTAAVVPAQTTAQTAPPAAGTAPPATAPTSVTTSPPNRKAEYEALKKTNPHAAQLFVNKYAAEIYGHH